MRTFLWLGVFLGAALLPMGAGAQPLRLEWPRSFTGQPDFAFTREEALKDAREREGAATLRNVPNLLTVASEERIPNPLNLRTPLVGEAGADAVSGTEAEISGTRIPGASRLLQEALAASSDLPEAAASPAPDLAEYRATLAQTLRRTVQSWEPDPARFDFSAVVESLTLQAVVTSPVRYAVINGQRLEVGETLALQVPIAVPDLELIAALQPLLPDPALFTPEEVELYQTTYEEVLAEFAKARNSNPELGRVRLALPVVVTHLHSRKVELDVYGRPYTLPVKFAY